MAVRPPVALTIAGSDSGGGAGIAADLKTFEAHGVWGTCAIAAVTAQNTTGVQGFGTVAADLVRSQVTSVASDLGVDAAKTGMLASAELVVAVAAALADAGIEHLVVDPVFVSKHGDTLLADDAVGALRDELLPRATVVTPNLAEAARLVGFEVTDRAAMAEAGRLLAGLGPEVVLVKGGHLGGDESPDCLVAAGAEPAWLESARLPGRHTHGTGCVLSAAICAEMARGMEPVDACVAAKRFTERAISAGMDLGRGVGPVNPGWERTV
ncbi:MAG: bifunctional hydroxymethylpyrimidine kinase/phosphomethylpyrimidine kinase [Actinomycetota bacterium]|nr:bifunctional hydroxymethylpyrimidine kinase/phosphomethylpyrimidine kinase [Actinomycetota bacterium]MDQ3680979.1 bifunctional hydroxymethylpyrimidine kinase/phosphomethylpyrimidine kinase [Actinomycetota bacterium]